MQPVPLLQVFLQRQLPRETLQTNTTRVFLFVAAGLHTQDTRVLSPQMRSQVSFVKIRFVAVIAAEQLLSRVNVHVLQVFPPQEETLVALVALESVILHVTTLMALQIRFLVRSVVAQVAGEPFRACVYQLVAGYVHGASERFAALVAAERSVDPVEVLQVLH